MKIIRLICIMMITGVFVETIVADNQMDNLRSTYDESALKMLLESIPIEAFVYENRHCGDTKFYPIGISQKGSLAYVSYVTNPQYLQWDFVIFDLVEDTILRKRSSEPHGEVVSPLEFFEAEKLIDDLREFGILLSDSPLKPQMFPLKYDNDSYTAELTENAMAGDDDGMYSGYTVSLKSSDKGSKRLTEISCSPCSNLSVEGYLLSPFEHRIVVIVRYDIAYVEG